MIDPCYLSSICLTSPLIYFAFYAYSLSSVSPSHTHVLSLRVALPAGSLVASASQEVPAEEGKACTSSSATPSNCSSRCLEVVEGEEEEEEEEEEEGEGFRGEEEGEGCRAGCRLCLGGACQGWEEEGEGWGEDFRGWEGWEEGWVGEGFRVWVG